MFYMYNPNTIFVKSVLACVSRSLLAQLKCERLTSRPDVDSFVERGVVDLADLESLKEQHNFPLEVTVSNLCMLEPPAGQEMLNLLLGELWMGRFGCWYNLEMITAEWLLWEHSSSV